MTLTERGRSWAHTQGLRLRAWALRKLRADHYGLDSWLANPSCLIAKEAFDQVFGPTGGGPGTDERPGLERAYQVAQEKGCNLAGYELRFVHWWYLGERRGRWG